MSLARWAPRGPRLANGTVGRKCRWLPNNKKIPGGNLKLNALPPNLAGMGRSAKLTMSRSGSVWGHLLPTQRLLA